MASSFVSIIDLKVGAGRGWFMRGSPHFCPESRTWILLTGCGLPFGEQPMLDREQARRRAVRRVDLRVDVFDVVAGRLRRHDEPLADLFGRQPLGKQPEDFHFARCEPGNSFAPPPDTMPGRTEDGLTRITVETACPHLGTKLAGRVFR